MTSIPKGAVLFEGVSKRYRLGVSGTLRDVVSRLFTRRGRDDRRILWALKDVSFRVDPGQALAIIGPNGAGKTTTLKLLARITQPTMGRIAVGGRLSSLIELGAGFHPELTGRENIYLNGAILGLRRQEIRRKLDAIIAFSGLERFIDTPVKRYSSGMYVRLGFAVAAHVEPDILLVDEVLAVGDASFRHCCVQRMRELQANGTTILFVSHNMHLVRDVCQTTLLLYQGQVASYGDTSSAIAEYERLIITNEIHRSDFRSLSDNSGFHDDAVILSSVDLLPFKPGDALTSDRPARIRICYYSGGQQPIGRVDVRILRQDGTLCCAVDSVGVPDLADLAGAGVIDVIMDPVQLTGGIYHVEVRITDPSDSIVLASAQSGPFVIASGRMVPEPGVFVPRLRWEKQR